MSFFDQIYKLGIKIKGNTDYLSYGRDVLAGFVKDYTQSCSSDTFRILDIGCGGGDDLINIRESTGLNLHLHGIEVYEPSVIKCREKGIDIHSINIEYQKLPFPDAYFDVVVINQVIEHLKEIFFVFSEISRVVKPDGLIAVGVPNIAAWHDRLAILLGDQPTCLKTLGPHVRGYTVPSFKRFIETDGFFKVYRFKGSGFYPFPAGIAITLSKIFPTLSTGIFFDIRRTLKKGNFVEVLKSRFYETNYFAG